MEKFIGCSGYYYNHWKGVFYPDDLPKNKWLIHYSKHFNTVELNNTFYRMPPENAVKNWYSITQQGFTFAVKGNRYFTHLRKLIIDDKFRRSLEEFIRIVGLLKDKAGPVLWQFPANYKADTARLENFCKILSKSFIHVFEFRHASWFNGDTYDILEKHNYNLCIISGPGSVPKALRATSPIVYVRFHGEGAMDV